MGKLELNVEITFDQQTGNNLPLLLFNFSPSAFAGIFLRILFER